MPKLTAQGVKKGPRMIKEIKRLKNLGLGKSKIGATLGISKNTVKKYLRLAEEQTQVILETKETQSDSTYHAPWSNKVDWNMVRSETVRGVQLKHYWEEWISAPAAQTHLDAKIPYESFWREYKRRYPLISIDFHKTHPPGEKCEVDYKGDSLGLGYYDIRSNTFIECRLFGSILCFSQLFFAKATLTEQQGDLLDSIADAFSYFGGVPHTTIVDNAKASVYRAHRYDPDFNPEFAKFCEHYGTAELAARPRKPKDKNLIENILGVFWRWAGPKIRERKFFSLVELNEFLVLLLDNFNDRIQKKYDASRLQRFLDSEKENLLPLPEQSYHMGQWKKLVVHPDCHVQVNKNFYSAPYQLRGYQLDVRVSTTFVEIFKSLERVAVHQSLAPNQRGQYRTDDKHLPASHIAMLEFTPRKALEEAKSIGPSTHTVISNLLSNSRHPLMYLRRIQGILRLKKRYSAKELEGSCERLCEVGISYNIRIHDIESIIETSRKCKFDLKPRYVQRSPNNPNLRGQETWEVNIK